MPVVLVVLVVPGGVGDGWFVGELLGGDVDDHEGPGWVLGGDLVITGAQVHEHVSHPRGAWFGSAFGRVLGEHSRSRLAVDEPVEDGLDDLGLLTSESTPDLQRRVFATQSWRNRSRC